MTDQDHRHTAPKRPENPSGRNYADELSPLTDASIRDNATMLLKELKTIFIFSTLYSPKTSFLFLKSVLQLAEEPPFAGMA